MRNAQVNGSNLTFEDPASDRWQIAIQNRKLTGHTRDGQITLIGRYGITGGALDSREGDTGPLYLQGDHTGGLKFRNITISLPR